MPQEKCTWLWISLECFTFFVFSVQETWFHRLPGTLSYYLVSISTSTSSFIFFSFVLIFFGVFDYPGKCPRSLL